jgi:hypothetical protein
MMTTGMGSAMLVLLNSLKRWSFVVRQYQETHQLQV